MVVDLLKEDLTNIIFYGIYQKKKNALDIGSNCGFFTLHASRFLKSIEGVEINPYLVRISNYTKEYLGIKNSEFYNLSFESLNQKKNMM